MIQVLNAVFGQLFCCSSGHGAVMPLSKGGGNDQFCHEVPVPISGIGCNSGIFMNMKVLDYDQFDPNCEAEADKVDRQLMRAGVSKGNPLRLQLLTSVRIDDAPSVLQHVADGADIPLMGEALRLAAHRGSAAVVRELVAIGICVNEMCPVTGFTPLQLSCASGHHVVCEVLLDALADVHRPINGSTPLNIAIKSGHAEVEEVLTRHIASLVSSVPGEKAGDGPTSRRAHVLPRVSHFLSDAVMQAMPSPRESTGDSGFSECNSAPNSSSKQPRSVNTPVAAVGSGPCHTKSEKWTPLVQEVQGDEAAPPLPVEAKDRADLGTI